jgi:hypothetical protein
MNKQTITTTTFTLLLAAYLFYPGGLFAQSEEKGRYRIMISKDENGQRTEIDTSFGSHDDMKTFLKEQDLEMDIHTSGNIKSSQVFVLSEEGEIIDHDELKAEFEQAEKEIRKARKELKRSGKELSDKELEDILKALKETRLELDKEVGENGKKRTEVLIDGSGDEKGNLMIWHDNHQSENEQRHVIEITDQEGSGNIEKVIIIRTDDHEGNKVIQKKRLNNNDVAEAEPQSGNSGDDGPKPSAGTVAEPESYRIADGQLKAYPNPSAGMLNIRYMPVNDEVVSIRVLDGRGRLVVEDTFSPKGTINKAYDLENNSKGTYLLQVRQGRYWRHEKIILK